MPMDSSDTLSKISEQASQYFDQGHYTAALPLWRQYLELCEQQLGPEHPDAIAARNWLKITPAK